MDGFFFSPTKSHTLMSSVCLFYTNGLVFQWKCSVFFPQTDETFSALHILGNSLSVVSWLDSALWKCWQGETRHKAQLTSFFIEELGLLGRNRWSSEIQGTALGKCLRARTCKYRSMPRSSGAVWKSRWTSWVPVPKKPTVSVDVEQHFNNNG